LEDFKRMVKNMPHSNTTCSKYERIRILLGYNLYLGAGMKVQHISIT